MTQSEEITKYTKNLSILFVEDHDELRLNTVNILQSIFKTVDSSVNGKEALEKYNSYKEENSKHYDIVLSDINMPIMNGIELTRSIYELNSEQLVIILSAHDDTEYLLQLINLGVEQFIQKPIDFQELLAAFLNAAKKILHAQDTKTSTSNISIAKDVTYEKDSKSINDNGENIYLTKFEIIFMELITSYPGKIFSNEEIVLYYQSLEEDIDSANIRKMISKLRKKLPTDSLDSVYGVGYKLIPYYNE